MSDIRIIPDEDIDRFLEIFFDAYPGMSAGTEKERKKIQERFLRRHDDPRISLYGLYRDNKLLGGLRLFDYRMNLFGTKVLAGGGGCLAVSLLHKKERVAKELMEFYFRHYRDKGAPLAVLWPFRPDFYKQMGCGLGAKIHVYQVKPENLPRGPSMTHVRFLTKDDLPALNDCYNRFAERTTGMIDETALGRQIGHESAENLKIVGYVKDGRVLGYLTFRFEKGGRDSFIDNRIDAFLMIYENSRVLSELLTFLHTQFDQIRLITIRTFDDSFHHLLKDPRNTSRDLIPPVYHETNVSAVGLMYRVLDTKHLFELLSNHSFGDQDCRLELTVKDSFMRANEGDLLLHFTGGKPHVQAVGERYDVQMTIDVSDFSSLVLGAVDMKSLHNYGLVEISDASYLDTLHKLFATDAKPVCTTVF